VTQLLATITGPVSGASVFLPANEAPGYIQLQQLPPGQGFRDQLFAASPLFGSHVELFYPWPGEVIARVPALNTPWFWRQLVDRRTTFIPQPRPSNPLAIDLFINLVDGAIIEIFGD